MNGVCVLGKGLTGRVRVGDLFLTGDSSIRLVPAGSLSVDSAEEFTFCRTN